MATLCRTCGRSNPPDATYCHFDGAFLQGSHVQGPADLAQARFRQPFHFPTGEICQNFDQLAIVCQQHWKEAWDVIRTGGLDGFLAGAGRGDLLAVTAQARAQTDPDRGVDMLLTRLPSRHLQPPHLRASPPQMQLGTLKPGKDRDLTIKLINDGHRLIAGSVETDCDWLQVEAAPFGQPHVVQFTHEQALKVRVVGAKLLAAVQPRTGKLLVITNAGAAEIAISCEVPIVPFEGGVLAGCRFPREVAVKARQFPDQASEEFGRGTVQAWYRANGWTYPVEGEPASGKAAVQQFFEALGLAKPPRVVLDTPAIAFQGAPGEKLRDTVELHSDEKRPIFAFGRSLCPWLSVVSHTAHGNHASVGVEAVIPHGTTGRLELHMEVRANGNQRFRVRVVLSVLGAAASATLPSGDDVDRDLVIIDDAPSNPFATLRSRRAVQPHRKKGRSCLLTCGLFSVLFVLLLGCAGFATWFMIVRPDIDITSPLGPFAAAVSPETCAVAAIDLDALEALPALADESRRLKKSVAQSFRDLDLKSDDPQPRSLFVAINPGERPLSVWTFASRVQLGKVVAGRFDFQTDKGQSVCIDRLDPTQAWAVDGQGRLIGGLPAAVRGMLTRAKAKEHSPVYANLESASTGISSRALAWAAGDFTTGGALAHAAFFGLEGPPPVLTSFRVELLAESAGRVMLRGHGACPTGAAAEQWHAGLARLPNSDIPMLPPAMDFAATVVGNVTWENNEGALTGEVGVHPKTTVAFLRHAATELDAAEENAQAAMADRAQKECEPGLKATVRGEYARAVEIFDRVAKLYPYHAEPRRLLKDAQQSQRQRQAYDEGLKAARDALEAGRFAAVRTELDRIKDSPFADAKLAALEKELIVEQGLTEYRAVLKDAHALVGRDQLDKASMRYKDAAALNPDDRIAAAALTAINRLHDFRAALKLADQHVRESKFDMSEKELMNGVNSFLKETAAAPWTEDPFKMRRERLLKDAAYTCRQNGAAFKAAADEARLQGDLLLSKKEFPEAQREYDKSLERLERLRDALADLKRIDGDAAVKADELVSLDAQLAAARQSGSRVKCQSLLAQGQKGLTLARTALKEAPSDPRLIAPTQKALDAVVKIFREAEMLEPRCATDAIRDAETVRKNLGRILRPVALDLGEELSRDDWSFQREQWIRKMPAEGKTWLQAVPLDPVQLKSVTYPWPTDFELAVEFALVDAKGKINNTLWPYFPDPLAVDLRHAKGGVTRLAIGPDEAIKVQRVARLALGKKEHTLGGKDLPAAEPIRLVLHREKGVLDVKIGDKKISALPSADTFAGLTLYIDNPDKELLGQRWSVAIYRLDVTWIGAIMEKAPGPEKTPPP